MRERGLKCFMERKGERSSNKVEADIYLIWEYSS